jgi:membrane protein
LARYSAANGGVLAGGIAYSALFSLFAALTIAFTALTHVLGGDQALTRQFGRQLAAWLPGVLDTGGGGLVSPEKLVRSGALSVTSLVAGVVLVVSASSAMAALRAGLRAMFGLAKAPASALVSRLFGLAGFALVGVALLIGAAASLAAASSEHWARQAFGEVGGVALRGGFLAAGLVLDAAVVAVLFRLVAGARPAGRDLLAGSLAAGALMGLAKQIGAGLVGGAASNALLASAAAIATLLVWVNLMARILLYAAAWTANPPLTPSPKKEDRPNAE